MINFRFHVVSIVAVFLALAIGVVFGSTIVDQAIVDQLRADVRNTEREVAETQDRNEELKSDLERWQSYVESNGRFAVEGRLEGDQVVVLAERGVDGDVVDDVRALLDAAGAAGSARVWLEPDLVDEEQIARLAELVDSSSDDPVVVRAQAYDALAAGLMVEPADDATTGATTTTTATVTVDLVAALGDAGFVEIADDLDAFAAAPRRDRRVLLLSTTDSALAAVDELDAVAGALDAVGLEVAVGEEYRRADDTVEDPLDRGARLVGIATGDLADQVATVDNLDEAQGAISLVISLADLRNGVAGHYGFGSGATRSAPEWSAA